MRLQITNWLGACAKNRMYFKLHAYALFSLYALGIIIVRIIILHMYAGVARARFILLCELCSQVSEVFDSYK